MALTTDIKADIVFKNLNGKSQTSDNFGVGNENYGIGFEVQSKDVTIDRISATNSQQPIIDGIAIRLRCDLEPIPDSGGKAFITKWPSNIQSSLLSSLNGRDPNNNLSLFEYGVGSLSGVSAGDRITNLISGSINKDYTAIPRASGVQIPPQDTRDWYYQYNSGILYQNVANQLPQPTTIDVYYYIGTRLSDFSQKAQTNVRISVTGSNIYYATQSNPMINTYLGNYIFLIDFANSNSATAVSLNINSIGTYSIFKTTERGPVPLMVGDIVGATGGSIGPIYYLVWNESGYFDFFYRNVQSNSGNFTNPISSNYSAGALEKGYSYNDVKFLDMFGEMFYPENAGRIATFSMFYENVIVSNKFEVGETFSQGVYTFSWDFERGFDFKDGTLKIEDITYVTQSQTYWQQPSAIPFTQSTGLTGPMGFLFQNPINSNVPNTRRFRLSVQRRSGVIVYKDFNIDWMWKVYHGGSTQSSLTASGIINLQNSTLATQSYGDWVLSGGGYKYIAMPEDSNFDINEITYRGLPFTIAGTQSGFTFTQNDINYNFVTVSNVRGVSKRYKIYRSKNEIGSTFSVRIK